MRCVVYVLLCSLLFCPLLQGENQNKVIVVGAGLAGLTSAYRLKQLGYDVEVYEARSRPGGRVCTAYFGSSYEELGGKNICDGGEAKYIRALIQEMGLTTRAYPLDVLSGIFFFNDCSHLIQELVIRGPTPTDILHQELLQHAQTANNLAEVIAPLFHNNPALASLTSLNIRGYMGSSASELSAHYLDIAFWDFYKMQYMGAIRPLANRCYPLEDIVGGNSRLIEELVKRLDGVIHYSMPLRKITFENQLCLEFDKNTTLFANYLILAIPASTLRDVEIAEGIIPEDQLFAIRTQQYGTNAKILVPIQSNQPIADIYNCLEDMGSWLNRPGDVMTWYYGGSYGDFNAAALSEIFHRDLSQLQKFLPMITFNDLDPVTMRDEFMAHYSTPVAVSWIQESFSKGSYSNLSPEQFKLFETVVDIEGERLRKVYRPVNGMIFFAGEHTSLHIPSTMEGAVHSGEQAAHLVHTYVGKSLS
jgi:monoamine oxidase